MCQLLEVSRSGYYEWLSRPPSAQADADQQVQDKVQRYFAQGRGTYGTRRIKHLLAQEGLQVSRRRIGRLLAQAGLRCKTRRKFKAPTDLRAGADGGAEPAQPGVYCASPRYGLRRGYYLSPYGRRLAVSRRGAGSVLAGGGRVVDGQPYAGRVGEPGVGDGDLSAPARSGVDHAYGPWQSVWG